MQSNLKTMPPSHPDFFILDVFSQQRYAGNQLAVFTPNRTYSDAEMQELAREMHFSETTFILSSEEREGGFDVRIFTPEEELPFAGHPTLGTAFVLRKHFLHNSTSEVKLNLGVGQIPVRWEKTDRGLLPFMTQIAPTFLDEIDRMNLSDVLHVDVGEFHDSHKAQIISTGMGFCIAPLRDLSSVRSSLLDLKAVAEFNERNDTKGILLFSPVAQESGNHIHARVFIGMQTIPEDPATGSACGCLAAYLSRTKFFGTDLVDVRVEQGYELLRPSILHVRSRAVGDSVEVRVGGNVIQIAEGTLS